MRVFGWSDGQGGVFHYRIREPLRGLRLRGHDTQTSPALQLKLASAHDVILVRALHNAHESKGWLALAQQGNHLLVYDLDDDLWAWHPGTSSAQYWNDERRLQAEINIQVADLVTTPSPHLAKILSQLNPNVHVLPNTVPRWLTSLEPQRRNRYVIGWEGAHQHTADLDLVYRPVFRFMLRHPNVEWHLWGPDRNVWLPQMLQWLPPGLEGRVKCFGWQPDVPSYYRSLSMDVCLAPLEDTPFNQTKSGLRIQEHSALAIPVIASPSHAHEGFLVDGVNGYTALSQAAWETHLETLYRNPTLGQQLGQNGRRIAKRQWTTEEQATIREQLYQEAMNERTRTRVAANARAGSKPTRPTYSRTGITTIRPPAGTL